VSARHEHDHSRDGKHAHSHVHGADLLSAGGRYKRRLTISFVLIASFFVVEAVGGYVSNSLALLSDAGHMLTDVLGLGMALAAITVADRHRRATSGDTAPNRHTFGLYRLEILAAFVNALLLFGIAIYVLIEAVRRLAGDAEVAELQMLVIAAIGLAVNLVVFGLLKEGAKESLNVEGAYLEVVADTLGSVGVIAAAIAVRATGWTWIDPVVGAAIGLWILPRTWRLGGQAVRILVQSSPPTIDLARVEGDLLALPTVTDVHDLHVWTLTSGMDALSAHIVIIDGADHHAVLDQARLVIGRDHGITHATFQVEPASHEGCGDVTW
jgi:cobalt-zinc-cadmium efflux system protein